MLHVYYILYVGVYVGQHVSHTCSLEELHVFQAYRDIVGSNDESLCKCFNWVIS